MGSHSNNSNNKFPAQTSILSSTQLTPPILILRETLTLPSSHPNSQLRRFQDRDNSSSLLQSRDRASSNLLQCRDRDSSSLLQFRDSNSSSLLQFRDSNSSSLLQCRDSSLAFLAPHLFPPVRTVRA